MSNIWKSLLFIGLIGSSTIANAAEKNKAVPVPAAAPATAVTAAASASTPPQTPQPARPTIIVPQAPVANAKGYILIDANSGDVIAAKNPDERMAPASLTKMMTLYIVSEALKSGRIRLEDKVKINEKAWKMSGSRMFVKLNEEVSVADLLKGIIVASGNDACVAMAQYIAGSESSFADLMNQTAAKLGMKSSHFTDSTGLPDPQHYSTPRDMAVLGIALIKDFPEYYSWYKEKWIKYNNIKQPNRNRLLWHDSSVDGVKTGHTDEAGYCLVASALRNGMRLVSVVMGAPSDRVRNNDSEDLLSWGFRFHETHKVFAAGTSLTTPRVWLGRTKHIPMGLSQDFYVTVPVGSYPELKANVVFNGSIKAPIIKGQAYGTVKITHKGKEIASRSLIALNDNPKGGIWSQLRDYTLLMFKKTPQ